MPPSRKRAKGKARKATQQANKQCDHGLLPKTSPRYWDFMDKFLAVVESAEPIMSTATTEAWSLAVFCHFKESNKEGTFFDLLTSEAEKKWGRSYLLGLATALLVDDTTSTSIRATQTVCAIALLISEVEEPETGWIEDDKVPLLKPKTRDLIYGNERDVIRFLKKRVSCSCLNDLYKQTKKKLPKVGMCNGCQKKKKRKDLMICNTCRVAQYCCVGCQKQDWPDHKRTCQGAYVSR